MTNGLGLRVLLVDDDVAIGMMLAIGLPEVEVVDTPTMADAREFLAGDTPDAVIIDRRLPDGDGLALVRDIRRTFATSRIPIVVITAGHDEADRATVTKAGADRYLAKPIDPEVLVAHISTVLGIAPADRKGHRAAVVEGRGVDIRDESHIDLTEAEARSTAHRKGRSWFRRRTG